MTLNHSITHSLGDGEDNKIHVDKKTGVEELHLIVKESAEKMKKILFEEGFTTVKFEHKQPDQIGSGLNLKFLEIAFVCLSARNFYFRI
mgnify:CR=1 FL=1